MPANEALSALTHFIYLFHMPAFVAISGMVFFICLQKGSTKYTSLSAFTLNKARRLLIPYVLFCCLWVYPTMLIIGARDINDFPMSFVKDYIFCEGNGHLWYVIMLFGVFMVYFIFRKWITRYQELFFLIFTILYSEKLFSLPYTFQLSEIVRYLVFYHLGYIIYSHRNEPLREAVGGGMSIFYLLALVYAVIFCPKMLVAIFFTLLIYLLSTWLFRKGVANLNIMQKLAHNSYGIYLFHPMLIYLQFYAIRNFDINPWLAVSVIFLIALFVSWFLTISIRKTQLRVAIGE